MYKLKPPANLYIYIFNLFLLNKIATRALADFFSKLSIFRRSFLIFLVVGLLNSTCIIREHRDTIRLLIHETLLIKFNDPNLNRQDTANSRI